MGYTLTVKTDNIQSVEIDAYGTDVGPVLKKSIVNLPECTISQQDPATRVEFMVAMLPDGTWCLFYARGGDWTAFGDGEQNNPELVEDWMPDAIRDCVQSAINRIGESIEDDMDWFIDWAGGADETLAQNSDE